MPVLKIGTRASELALRQAALVRDALRRIGVESELVTFKTTGDKRINEPLPAIGAKGLFTAELERALLRRKVDLNVHSLKDLPTDPVDGLVLGAMLPREDPRDVLVVSEQVGAERLGDLPRGSRVGTSSLRRRALLRLGRPDLEVVELRGNVPTRLRKVEEGQVHAAVLAAAGLHRLGVERLVSEYLQPPEWLPAAGQGIIAVQVRDGDSETAELVAGMDDRSSRVAARAERAFLHWMDGGCQVPIGALAVAGESGAALTLYGMIADVRGSSAVRGERVVTESDPEDAGRELARELRERGGDELLARLRPLVNIPSPQPE